jgi:hypothetical protein
MGEVGNVGYACEKHASKPGAFKGKDPKSFLGLTVKLGFPATHPETGKPCTEHMWVLVQGLHEMGLQGNLRNDPVMICEYVYDDKVAFGVDEIEAVYHDA